MLKYIFVLSTILLLIGCSPNPKVGLEQTIIVKKGNHRSVPYHLTWNKVSKINYKYTTNDTWAYELGNDDQCDWNKLGGVSLHLLTSHENSAMIAVRYDRTGKLLLSPYYHEDGTTYWITAPCSDLIGNEYVFFGDEVIDVNIGESFEVDWVINEYDGYISMTITTENDVLFWEKYWSNFFTRTREISPYFGGNRTAPHDWVIIRELIYIE